MKNTKKKPLCFVSPLFFLLLFCTAALIVPQDAAQAARLSRWRHSNFVNSDRQVNQPDLTDTVTKIKSNPVKPKNSDLIRCKKLLLKECNTLIKILAEDPNREAAENWREVLKLDSIKSILVASELPDFKVINEAWSDFNQDKTGLRWEIFNGVRNELRRYQVIHGLLNLGNDYESEFAKVCDSLESNVHEYIRTASPVAGATLNELVIWFNDISLFEPRASQIIAAVRKKVSVPNIQFTVSDRFMSNGFSRVLTRDIEVNETIQGTKIIGSGSMTGTSSSSIVTRSKDAAIDIIIDTDMETETTGYHPPVTLNTRTTGKLTGKKRVLLAPNKISALPATSTADLKADIYNVRVNAGALVSCIARRQVEDQREDSLAEAKLRTEARLNDQIDAIVNAEIADANEQYQKSFRRPLKNLGLLPEFNISSIGADKNKGLSGGINGRALVGTTFQPSSTINAPDVKNTYDVFVQLHQSLPNNIAAFALAGKNFNESESNLSEQFSEIELLRQIFERKDDQEPIAIKFAEKAPTVITFEEDIVRIVIRINAFFQNGTTYPGLDITLVYKIKTEQTANGNLVVVLEQVEKPDAMLRGKTKVSARIQTIRTIVMRRLESVPKRIELKPFGLKWKGWQDSGELAPVFAKSTSGWLTIGFNWIQKNK
ncbi:MAG: hypothetical protein LBC74_09730 [Planctomycetaceae bacterium]|jgi:hypothetical protein|nr:hypothetical protein [Planctomycetaceae bacterium]